MKKRILTLLSASLLFTVAQAQVSTVWSAEYNGTGNNSDIVKKVVVDRLGNSYVTGYSYGASGLYNYATVKYNSSGSQQWATTFNGTGNNDDRPATMLVDSGGNVYVTGYSFGSLGGNNFATIKYNSSGVQQWVTTFNGTASGNDQARVMAIDSAGNVYVSGYTQSSVGGQNFATIKYDNNGVQQWVTEYNGTGNAADVPQGIAVDGNGMVYVTGYSIGATGANNYATVKYNNSGVQQWAVEYNGTGNSDDFPMALGLDRNGECYITGYTIGLTGANNYTTLKYNAAGVLQWATDYNGTGNSNDYPLNFAVDPNGNSYVTGYTTGATGGYNYATLKYNSSGTQQWLAVYNGTGNNDDYAYGIAIDTSGNCYVTGAETGASGGFNYATVKYNTNGAQQWVSSVNGNGNGNDIAISVAADSSGNAYVSGYSLGASGIENYLTIKYCSNPAAAGSISGTSVVCQGQAGVTYSVPLILNATAYNWVLPAGATIVSGANTNSITVDFGTNAVSGNISVQGTGSCNSGAASTFPVMVNPLPATGGTITGTDTVCQGQSWVSYYVASINSATGYIWNLPAGATIISGANTNSINVNYSNSAVSGTIDVTGTNSCGTGLASAGFSVTVNPMPGAAGMINGTDTLCEGQTGVMYVVPAISDAISYSWTWPNGVTVSGGNNNDTMIVDFNAGAMSGMITVEGINFCGMGTSSMLSIVVNPMPAGSSAISGTASLCEGQTGIMYWVSPIANATGYTWVVPAGATITAGANTNAITVSFALGASSGNISVEGTNTCGVGSMSTFAVTVNPLPVVAVNFATDSMCFDAAGMPLTGGTPAGGTYSGLGAINGNFYPALAGVGTHVITYDYTDPNGCSGSATASILVDACLGIDEAGKNTTISVYPNPNSGQFTLSANFEKNGQVQTMLYDLVGKNVLSAEETVIAGNYSRQIDISGLSNGIYILVVKTNDQNIVRKIVKE